MAPKINPNATRLIDEAFSKFQSPYREICEKLRAIVHKAEPGIIEDWKWGPNFNKNGMVCNIWAFKGHASLVFFRGTQMKDAKKLFNFGEDNKGTRTIKFTALSQVKEKDLVAYVREAVKLNMSDVVKPVKLEKTIDPPPVLAKWFLKNKKAKAHFDSLAYTVRKEMVLALTGAKQEATRERRFKKITEALLAGKKDFR